MWQTKCFTARKLDFLHIIKKKDGKYAITESWLEKIDKDRNDYGDSKTRLKLSFTSPEYCIFSLVSVLNNEENQYLGGYGAPGGGGGGFRYRKIIRRKATPEVKPAEKVIPSDVVSKFKNENLLSLSEISGLLSSDDIESKIQGAIHLFRMMKQQNEYSKTELMLNALEVNSSQLAELVKNELQTLFSKEKGENLKHLKDFVYNLFSKQIYMRSEFLDLAFSVDDKDYFERFVKLLLENRVTKSEDQAKVIKQIVKTKKTEYIPKLFGWRFTSTNMTNGELITVESFFAEMLKLNRDKCLVQTIVKMKQSNAKWYWDMDYLGRAFFKEIMGCDSKSTQLKKVYIKTVKPEKISENKQYLDQICYFTIDYLRWDFYTAVASNCDIYVDQIVYEWFANEKVGKLQMILLKDFAANTLNFELNDCGCLRYKDVDAKNMDIDALRKEIRYNEKRFTTFASYVMQSKHHRVQYELFQIAPKLQAAEAWRIIKHFFDLNAKNEHLSDYFDKIDRLEADTLGLIEIDRLKRYLYAYLIDELMNNKRINALTTALKILSD